MDEINLLAPFKYEEIGEVAGENFTDLLREGKVLQARNEVEGSYNQLFDHYQEVVKRIIGIQEMASLNSRYFNGPLAFEMVEGLHEQLSVLRNNLLFLSGSWEDSLANKLLLPRGD